MHIKVQCGPVRSGVMISQTPLTEEVLSYIKFNTKVCVFTIIIIYYYYYYYYFGAI